jgi:antitoxin (DNA-binding transcriptional repressor) of toxin-antitoxin stability system
MSTVTLEEAQAHLPELIDQLQPGSEIIITRNDQPVAKLTSQTRSIRRPRTPGTLRGTVLYMAPDFNAPLDEFKEYMK